MSKEPIKIVAKPQVTVISFILGTVIGGVVECFIGIVIFTALFSYYLKYSGASPGFGFYGGIAIIWVAILNSICGALVSGVVPVNKWQGAIVGILLIIGLSFGGSISRYTVLDISFNIIYFLTSGLSCFVSVWFVRDVLKIGVKIEDDFDLGR